MEKIKKLQEVREKLKQDFIGIDEIIDKAPLILFKGDECIYCISYIINSNGNITGVASYGSILNWTGSAIKNTFRMTLRAR